MALASPVRSLTAFNDLFVCQTSSEPENITDALIKSVALACIDQNNDADLVSEFERQPDLPPSCVQSLKATLPDLCKRASIALAEKNQIQADQLLQQIQRQFPKTWKKFSEINSSLESVLQFRPRARELSNYASPEQAAIALQTENEDIAEQTIDYGKEEINFQEGAYDSKLQQIHVICENPFRVAQTFIALGNSVAVLNIVGSKLEEDLESRSLGVVSALKKCGLYPESGDLVPTALYTPHVVISEAGDSVAVLTTTSPRTLLTIPIDYHITIKQKIYSLLKIAHDHEHDVLILGDNLKSTRVFIEVINESFPGAFKAIVFAIEDSGVAQHVEGRLHQYSIFRACRHESSDLRPCVKLPSESGSFEEYQQRLEEHLQFPKTVLLEKNFILSGIKDRAMCHEDGTCKREELFSQINKDGRRDFLWRIGGSILGIQQSQRQEDIAVNVHSSLIEGGLNDGEALRVMCSMHQGTLESLWGVLSKRFNLSIEENLLVMSKQISSQRIVNPVECAFDCLMKILTISASGWGIFSLEDPATPLATLSYRLTISCNPSDPITYGQGFLEYTRS